MNEAVRMRRVVLSLSVLALIVLSACKTNVDVKVPSRDSLGPLRCDAARLSLDETGGLSALKQQRGNWCWAASALEVMSYHGYENIEQCDLVTEVNLQDTGGNLPDAEVEPLSGEENLPKGCCSDVVGLSPAGLQSFTTHCEVTGWPSNVFQQYNINYNITPLYTALSWEALQRQLCDVGPYIFAVEWIEGGRHTGVIEGYYRINEGGYEKWVGLNDHSGNGFFMMPYDEFVQDPTSHKQYVNFFNIRQGP
jgi:hypothetical protein